MTDVEAAIRGFLVRRHQVGLDNFLVRRIYAGDAAGVLERIMTEQLAQTDHDTQLWWKGTCNCDGHVN